MTEIGELLSLPDEELAELAALELFGSRNRASSEKRLFHYLEKIKDETRGAVCAVLQSMDIGESGNVEGIALIADLLAASTGKPTPFSLVVFIMRRGRDKMCSEQTPQS